MLKYKIPQIVTLIRFKCDRNPATWGTYLDILFLPTVEDKKGASLSGCP